MLKMLAIGHLGKDAEVNTVNGKNVINFNVAHTEKYTDRNGQKVDKTMWVQCSYWTDKTAIAPYLKKGTQVYVEGQPDVRAWVDNGNKEQATQLLRVATIQLLGSKQGGGDAPPANSRTTTPPAAQQGGGFVPVDNGLGDDLPF